MNSYQTLTRLQHISPERPVAAKQNVTYGFNLNKKEGGDKEGRRISGGISRSPDCIISDRFD